MKSRQVLEGLDYGNSGAQDKAKNDEIQAAFKNKAKLKP